VLEKLSKIGVTPSKITVHKDSKTPTNSSFVNPYVRPKSASKVGSSIKTPLTEKKSKPSIADRL
jgi:hypothetical protein